MTESRPSYEWLLIGAFAAAKLLLHLLTSTNYELHRDAFLYLAQSNHLDFGFISVPPLVAIIGKLATSLLGNTTFSARFFPALTGGAATLLAGMMVKRLAGRGWAIAIACAAFLLSPAYLRSNSLLQPVAFNQFFWLLSGYLLLRLIQTHDPKNWLYLGITFGIAFQNKYAIVFFIFAALVALLLTPDRSLFASRYFGYGIVLGMAITLPNIYWQYQHRWPVVHHMMELQETQLVHVRVADFIAMQFLMNFPAIAIWLFALVFMFAMKEGKSLRLFGYLFTVLVATLLVLHGKAYYTLGLYPILFAIGGYAIEVRFAGKIKLIGPALLILMLALTAPILPFSLPLLPHDAMAAYASKSKKYGMAGALRWEDGRVHTLPQDYADMTGWRELAEIVAKAYLSLSDEERATCQIYAENYGEAGAILFYGRKYGLPEPVSFSASFLLWAPDSISGSTLIYVNDDITEISTHFTEVRQAGKIMNPYARESGLPVYICRKPVGDFMGFYREKVRTLRSVYYR